LSAVVSVAAASLRVIVFALDDTTAQKQVDFKIERTTDGKDDRFSQSAFVLSYEGRASMADQM